MKSYTSLKQSKKLAEILPLESADMCYGLDDDTLKYDDLPWFIAYHKYTAKEFYIPCWSLTALLDVLPKTINNETLFIETSPIFWHIGYRHIYTPRADNLVDACVEMIIHLNKLKML